MPPCINAAISIIKNLQHDFSKKKGGGSKVDWNFSKNSFGLVAGPLIKIQPTQRNVLHTSLPLYELDIPFGTKNEPSSVEINILGM